MSDLMMAMTFASAGILILSASLFRSFLTSRKENDSAWVLVFALTGLFLAIIVGNSVEWEIAGDWLSYLLSGCLISGFILLLGGVFCFVDVMTNKARQHMA